MKVLLALLGILALGGGTLLGMVVTSIVGEMHFHDWLQHPRSLWTQPFHEWQANPKPPMGPTDPLQRQWRDLALLVAKLEALSAKAANLHLTDKQRAELLELLKQTDNIDQLSDEEAQKQLDALLKLLEPNKDALDAVGYHWPGATDVQTQETFTKNLQNLRETLGKNKSP
jgi:hypothetical protein